MKWTVTTSDMIITLTGTAYIQTLMEKSVFVSALYHKDKCVLCGADQNPISIYNIIMTKNNTELEFDCF